MDYTVIDLFGRPRESKGTFDDLYSNEYKTIQDAYDAGDWVQMDYVKDENWCIVYPRV